MDFEVLDDEVAVAHRAAAVIAADARKTVAARGMFSVAVSGGHTLWVVLRALANEQLAWEKVHAFQINAEFLLW